MHGHVDRTDPQGTRMSHAVWIPVYEALFLDEGERLVGRVLVLVDELAERVELLPERGQARVQVVAGLRAKGMCAGRIVPSATPVAAWPGTTFTTTAAAW